MRSSSSPARRERCTPASTASMPAAIARTALLDSSCTAPISPSISFVLEAVRWASVFTWFATTAKALPCSPAWAAMIAAFSDSRFVSSLIDPITFTISPISPIRSARRSSTSFARLVCARMTSMPSMVEATAWEPASAPSLTCSVSTDASRTWSPTSWIARSICTIAAADSSAIPCTESALSATCRMLALISWIDDVEASTDSFSEAALRATSSIELCISRIEDDASSVERERLSTSALMLRIEVLMLARRDAVSSTASSVALRPASTSCIAASTRSGSAWSRSTTAWTSRESARWRAQSAFSTSLKWARLPSSSGATRTS